ncbi:MAG: DUF1576 domain-containing protein [Erysipelotrichaceae bacterium]|nr:DUF1576 domain-containing protein [Erysipelotrichaceae bacterium]
MKIRSFLNSTSSNRKHILLLLIYPLMCFAMAFLYNDGGFNGLYQIITSPALLIQDALVVGGISGALLNVGIIALFNILILVKLDVNFNGMLLAAFFTVFGFSFMGMNVYNILPIYLGGYLYSLYTKRPFKNIILVSIFAACLSPIVSHSFFGFDLNTMMALLLSVVKGAALGFFIVPLGSSMLRFHEGFNLYNIGFTSGIVAIVYASVYRSFFGPIQFAGNLVNESSLVIVALVLITSIHLILLSFIVEKNPALKLKDIMKSSGRLVSDFTSSASLGASFLNMGLLGIFSMIVVIGLKGSFSGPVVAGIYTVLGFGAFGKHLFNCIPVMLGGVLAAILLGYELSSAATVVPVLFVTTIAPIAGVYGVFWGMIAGFLHVTIVAQFGGFHAGMNLYNNGFTGGIVAGLLVPIINTLRRKTHE